MRYLPVFFAFAAAAVCIGCHPPSESENGKGPSMLVNIIPQPLKLETGVGAFVFGEKERVELHGGDSVAMGVVRQFAASFGAASGFTLESAESVPQSPARLQCIIDASLKSALGEEGYRLNVTPESITVAASSPNGLFYGFQTLRQLLPVGVYSPFAVHDGVWQVPCVSIVDVPRFSWRGGHLDVSRHFFPMEVIKEYVDILAMHKMNVFHWHLVDDQGWRIQIEKYPRLTSVGAWRVDRESVQWDKRERQKPGESATFGGFYTQEEVKEIVAYARARFVTIVPEIEMPAHSVAALSAYPEFSCTGGPFTVLPGAYWPNVDIYCAGNDSTFHFLEDVLTEVMELFPSQFIHIGGDEANKANWQQCPKCKARIASEGLKDEKELQSYFIRRIERFLSAHGRRLIGWDEILEGGLAAGATVMSWRGVDGGIDAAKSGHDVVMTPTEYCYFDYSQAKAGDPEAIGGFLPMEKVYQFEPVPPSLTTEEGHHILGAQANLWTEFVPTRSQAEFMLLPRLCALAEVVWSPAASRNYESFLRRLDRHYPRLDRLGLRYRDYRKD